MKKYLFFLLFLLYGKISTAQRLQPSSLNSGGQKVQVGNYILNYTVGQPYIGTNTSETTPNGNYKFSHGFQQYMTEAEKYNIGEIPNQVVYQGNTIEFFLWSRNLGVSAQLSMSIDPPPVGEISFSGITGYFSYKPDTNDVQPFTVTFKGKLGSQVVSQTITITPEHIVNQIPGSFFSYTGGTFNVSESGTASYNIPITTTTGTGGIQPELAFSYSSNNSNGIMGIGWLLSGLSTISRSPETYEQDNHIDGVDFDDLDKFNLDGERLITIGGGVYGGNGAKYYTEQNTFNRITSFKSNVLTHFIVESKAGLIKEYGNTEDSRIEAQNWPNTVMFWALNKITDTKGNYMTFSYFEDPVTHEFYPTEINYTGNATANLTPYNKVVFTYENRPDPTKTYVFGSLVLKTKRLKTITVKYGNAIIREYRLVYANTISSKLIRIEEFGKGGIVADQMFAPISFNWNENVTFNMDMVKQKIPASEFNTNTQVLLGDWNRDGYSDVLLYEKNTGTNKWFINNGNLGFTKLIDSIPPARITGGTGLYFGDWNGDGISDIMWWDKATGANRWFLGSISSNGNFQYYENTGFVTTSEIDEQSGQEVSLYVGDYNGDGLTDFFWYNKTTGEQAGFVNQFNFTNNQISFNQKNNFIGDGYYSQLAGATVLNVGDWNADGLCDVMVWKKGTGENYWFLNNGFVGPNLQFQLSQAPILTNDLKGGSDIYLGDWNADGVTDLLWFDNVTGNNRWFINKGNYQFETKPENLINPNYLRSDSALLYINDWNSDGLTDLVWNNYFNGDTKWFINKGEFFFDKKENILPQSLLTKGSGFMYGDWKGTGTTGILWFNKDNGDNYWFTNNVTTSNLIHSIRKGSGELLKIQYKSLIDTSVYVKYYNPIYPETDFISPMQVVSCYSLSNGSGGFNTFKYQYEGGKANVRGRGFRGFQKVSITDLQTGIKNINLYERDFKYVGASLKKSIQLTATNDTLSVIDNTNAYKLYNSSYFSYFSDEITKKYELGNTFISSTHIFKEYDNFGNPTKIIIDYSGGNIDTVFNTYNNDELNWFLGRLTKSIVSRTTAGQATIRRTSSFEYDALSGILKKEILEPGNQLQLTKTYIHDAFGNILTSTTTGFDGVQQISRTNTTTYDNKGRFVITSTNAAGHTETRDYDPIMGTQVLLTGPNGLTTIWQYDEAGRKIRETRPDGTETILSYRWVKDMQSFNPPIGALYAIYTQSTGKPIQIVWNDSLGREMQIETEGFDNTHICVDKVYNSTGDLIKTSEPYFKNAQPLWNLYEYDVMSRITKQTAPGNRITQKTYQGLTTITTNQLGQTKTETVDVLGRLTSVTDNTGNLIHYYYNSAGSLIRLLDAKANEIQMEYDLFGNKTKFNDPDLGITTYNYNAFGELITQIDALGNTVVFAYDSLSRVIKRTEPEGVTTYSFDTKNKGIGKIATVKSANNYIEEYNYDGYGRLNNKTEKISGINYPISFTYDSIGNIKTLTYPSGFIVQNEYNSKGYLSKVKRQSDGYVYWQAQQMNARLQLEQALLGNGVVSNKAYNDETGFLDSIYSVKNQNVIQSLSFQYNALGSLTQRRDIQRNLTEDFIYDALNRLTSATVIGHTPLTMQFDMLGNITYKSDLGNYTYGEGTAGPHAVTSVKGQSVTNSKLITSLEGNIQYTSFRKAKSIVADSNKVEITYNYSYARQLMKVYQNNVLKKTRLYIGAIYEKETGDTSRQIHYIRAGNEVVAVYTIQNPGNQNTIYWHRDNLGSVQSVTNENGDLLDVLSYDAWGKRRNANTWVGSDTNTSTQFDRGFTGHEHLDLVSLINMNGRLYDPMLGRFTSADPYISDITDMQSLNRYSYVNNNPLTYVDPSGYWGFKSIVASVVQVATLGVIGRSDINKAVNWVDEHKKEIAIIAITVAATVGSGGTTAGLAMCVLKSAAIGFGSTYISARLSGASNDQAFKAGVKAAIISGVTAGLTYGVNSTFAINGDIETTTWSNVLPKSISNGIIQGLSTEEQGGKFEHGFLVGSFATASVPLSNSFSSQGTLTKVTTSAIISGTDSELRGGKFVNGAFSGVAKQMYEGSELQNSINQYKTTAESQANDILMQIQIKVNQYLNKEKSIQNNNLYDKSNIDKTSDQNNIQTQNKEILS